MQEDLQELPLFKNIQAILIEELIANGQIMKQSYGKGVTVHEQGTRCHGIDIVCSGMIIAYSLTINGSETIVSEFHKNSVIGANLLFGDQNKYPMDIYSTTDSTLFHVSKAAIIRLLKEYSFVIAFIKSLSLNSQGINQKILMYTQKTLRENLIDYLSSLSREQNSNVVILPISKKQLADKLGVQRPSLFRELKRMKDEGLVEVDNRLVKIKIIKDPANN